MRRANFISRDHPLRHFFAGVVRRRFDADLRLPDPRLAEYVSGLLVDFTPADSLYLMKEDLESRQRAYYRGLRETFEG